MKIPNKPLLGSHVSFQARDYLLGSVREALSYGADAMMIYLGAPQTTRRVTGVDFHLEEALAAAKAGGLEPEHIIVHAPYIVNLANPDPEKSGFAESFLDSELLRAEQFGLQTVVLHPGAAVGQPVVLALQKTAAALRRLTLSHPGVTVALETMAGKGTEIGRDFAEIGALLKLIDTPNVGVCLDTCHLNDAGYELADFDGLIGQMTEYFDPDRVRCIHLNDSKNPIGAHKDRHANIGLGTIGFEILQSVLFHERFAGIPKILETPYIDGVAPYREEIRRLLVR